MRNHAHCRGLLLLTGVALCAGCQPGTFKTAPTAQANASNVFQQQAQTLTTQVQDLNRRVAQLDANNADLTRQLAQAQQQTLTHQQQVDLLKGQLASAATLARDAQLAKTEADKKVTALETSTRMRGGATITANSSVKQSLATVAIPGLEIRQDGEVLRIEIPGDKLFAPGSGQLQIEGYRILDEVAAAIQRSYSRQRIVIEGHTDDALVGNPTASHALTSSQAGAVFQQLVQRGRLPAQQLSVLALGENHPLASNGTPAGKAKNRRIEIVIYPDTIDG